MDLKTESIFMLVLFFLLTSFCTAQTQVELSGLSSGRYEIRRDAKKTTQTSDSQEEHVVPPVKKQKRQAASEETEAIETTEATSQAVAQPVTQPKENQSKVETPKNEPNLSEQVQSLGRGDTEQVYQFYQERVHPTDVRNNRLEIELAPGIVSQSSRSNYSYKSFDSSYTSLSLKANLWFTPMLGLSARYLYSLSADISGDASTRSRVSVKNENMDLAFTVRKYFGLSRRSNSLEVKLLYLDERMSVASDSTVRTGQRSYGLGLGLVEKIPQTLHYAWLLGAQFYPKIQNTELQTALNLRSGSGPDSNRVGALLGGEYKMDRENQVFWEASIQVEKNAFTGSASATDTETGLTPTNVSVTNTKLSLSLGYRWGQ